MLRSEEPSYHQEKKYFLSVMDEIPLLETHSLPLSLIHGRLGIFRALGCYDGNGVS